MGGSTTKESNRIPKNQLLRQSTNFFPFPNAEQQVLSRQVSSSQGLEIACWSSKFQSARNTSNPSFKSGKPDIFYHWKTSTINNLIVDNDGNGRLQEQVIAENAKKGDLPGAQSAQAGQFTFSQAGWGLGFGWDDWTWRLRKWWLKSYIKSKR